MKKSFPLRIEDELYLKLQAISENNSRSVNKEIEYMIKQYILQFEKENGSIRVNPDTLYE